MDIRLEHRIDAEAYINSMERHLKAGNNMEAERVLVAGVEEARRIFSQCQPTFFSTPLEARRRAHGGRPRSPGRFRGTRPPLTHAADRRVQHPQRLPR